MTSHNNGDMIAAMLQHADKVTQEKIVLDIVYKHEIGCFCSMCESIKSRFPQPDATNPDRFAEQGGDHSSYPFDASAVVQLQVISRAIVAGVEHLAKMSSAVESLRDVLRGRDSEDKPVKGPIRAIADHIINLGRPAEPTKAPPQTQRTPPQTQQQLPIQTPVQVPTPQTNPYQKQKRIATDQEMARFKSDQKVRFDPKNWPGNPHKGRMLIQCEPAFLDIYADQIEYFAGKAKEKVAAGTADDSAKKDAQWGELNAAQYRRLAQDMRAGLIQQAPPPVAAYSGGSDLI